MKLIAESQPLPGITDNNFDVITQDRELLLLHKGQKIPFSSWPLSVITPLESELKHDSKAQLALDDMGIIEPAERLKLFTYCNFGGYDNKPDFLAGTLNREYWECGYRGKCKYEGALCALVQCKNGHLSPREIQVLKAITKGLQDKEIADLLDISIYTVRNHRAKISEKTGLQNRTEMAGFAREKNISK